MIVPWWVGVVLALVAAVAAGEMVHHRRNPGRARQGAGAADESHGGFRLDLLAGSALTLAVVMCSFMLAISYDNFDKALGDASAEAGAVASMYQAASVLPDRASAQRLGQDTICYARSIVSDEWPELGDRTVASPLVEKWRRQLQVDLAAVASGDQSAGMTSALSALRDADQARTASYQVRLVTSSRVAPWYLFVLLILVCGFAIFFVTAFTVQNIPRRLRLSVVSVLTLLLGSTLAVIVDLSHPYNGISTIGPGYLAQVAGSDTSNYAALWAGRTVSLCDPGGRPTPR